MTHPPDRKQVLLARHEVLSAIRAFFLERDFIEVDTPVRIPAPALELHIDAEVSGAAYLRTSPELHMKRLLAEGFERIFQVGPCFRFGERGRLHSPEFTMLEWYRADADYMDMLRDTKALMGAVCQAVGEGTTLGLPGQPVDVKCEWTVLSVAEAFRQHAGWDPVARYDADRFDLDLVDKVEPALPKHVPVVLKDYPAEASALARLRAGERSVAERWELYIAGIELAGAFSELTDAAEQRARFEDCAEQRCRAGKPVYELDEAFLEALEDGMPPSGGTALGVDRLVMLLTGSDAIDEVRAFAPGER